MAYLPNSYVSSLTKEKKKEAESPMTTTSTSGVAAGNADSSKGPVAPVGGRGEGRPSGNSGYVNIENYLKLNEASGSKLGNQVSVSGKVDEYVARKNLEALKNAYSKKIAEGTTAYSGDAKLPENGGVVDNSEEEIGRIDVTAAEVSPDEKARLSAIADAGYKGPNNFDASEEGAKSKSIAESLAKKGDRFATQEGLAGLLQERNSTRAYGGGALAFDSLLASQSSGGSKALNETATNLKAAQGDVMKTRADLNTQAAVAKTSQDNISQKAKGEVAKIAKFEKDRDEAVKNLKAQQKKEFKSPAQIRREKIDAIRGPNITKDTWTNQPKN